jgi:hypothetical protein
MRAVSRQEPMSNHDHGPSPRCEVHENLTPPSPVAARRQQLRGRLSRLPAAWEGSAHALTHARAAQTEELRRRLAALESETARKVQMPCRPGRLSPLTHCHHHHLRPRHLLPPPTHPPRATPPPPPPHHLTLIAHVPVIGEVGEPYAGL